MARYDSHHTVSLGSIRGSRPGPTAAPWRKSMERDAASAPNLLDDHHWHQVTDMQSSGCLTDSYVENEMMSPAVHIVNCEKLRVSEAHHSPWETKAWSIPWRDQTHAVGQVPCSIASNTSSVDSQASSENRSARDLRTALPQDIVDLGYNDIPIDPSAQSTGPNDLMAFAAYQQSFDTRNEYEYDTKPYVSNTSIEDQQKERDVYPLWLDVPAADQRSTTVSCEDASCRQLNLGLSAQLSPFPVTNQFFHGPGSSTPNATGEDIKCNDPLAQDSVYAYIDAFDVVTTSENFSYDPTATDDTGGQAGSGRLLTIMPRSKSTCSAALQCPYPSCSSKKLFKRQCDVDKHYRQHFRKYFCRFSGCQMPGQNGSNFPIAFATTKDRDRHETAHNPSIPCHYCGKLFSRQDNLRDHCRKRHLDQAIIGTIAFTKCSS